MLRRLLDWYWLTQNGYCTKHITKLDYEASFDPMDGGYHVCRTCERERAARYEAKKNEVLARAKERAARRTTHVN